MSRRGLAGDAGQLLRTTREMRGLSQARLAELAGVSQQRVSNLERGTVDARLRDLERLFGGLGLRLRVEAVPGEANDRQVWVPTLPWLLANDPDVADLQGRLMAAGWSRPAGWPAAG